MRFLLLVLIFVPAQAIGCSCFDTNTPEDYVKTFPIVAKIRLIKFAGPKGPNFRFKLIKTYKGEDPTLGGIIENYKVITSCHADLKHRQQWIVFLNEADEDPKFGGCYPAYFLKKGFFRRDNRKFEQRIQDAAR